MSQEALAAINSEEAAIFCPNSELTTPG
ncbi:unnamed protein product [Oikopleura dioica]|uniref:Uncharacterized protein n=1 Tax=Oikopleura dioica TaxID=34765 RepID=E4XS33_OIKDI|nr:unnamed protein product [Oikopleura dioica]